MRKTKGFSIIEVIVASMLSLSLGVLVATTLNSATKSLRTTNSTIQADVKAREVSSYIQKFVSSADKRSYCDNINSQCLNLIKYEQDPNFSYYYSDASKEVLQFFSGYCAKATGASGCLNSDITNLTEMAVTFDKVGKNLSICQIIPTGNTIFSKNDLMVAYSISNTSEINCSSTSGIKKVYNITGVSAINPNIFNFVDKNGQDVVCTSPATLTCLKQIYTVRFSGKVDWNLPAASTNKKRNGQQYSTIELYINLLGNSKNE